MRSSHEIAGEASEVLDVELELAQVAIQKCLVLINDYVGPNTKKLWLHTHTHTQVIPYFVQIQIVILFLFYF